MATSAVRKPKRKRAKKALSRKPAKPGFPTDEESIEFRRANAEKECASVLRDERSGEFYGTFRVGSTQWDEPYVVEIRSLGEHINTCTCQDHHMNQLGTCKHIERVLQRISHRKKTRYAKAADGGQPAYEVFLDMRMDNPAVRLLPPFRPFPAAERVVSPFFGADGTLLGDPLDAMPALERAIAKSSPGTRRRIQISRTLRPFVDGLNRRQERRVARAMFLEDVQAGKRTLDPVKHSLYPYQQDGMLHLAFGERAMLADEMGLGKTVQAIAACELLHQLRGVQRVMIVCPTSLKAEWEEQIRFFTGRQAKLVFGPRAARLRAYREDHFYFVTNYEQVRSDVDDMNEVLAPDVIILDEAQRIKNWPTKTAKTIKRLRSPYAFVLTGTPLENRIEEIYSLVEFLDPQLFGSLFRFQREFLEVDDEGTTSHRNLPELHRRVNSVMLRRRKGDVEGDLPERTTKTFFVPMEKEQRARHEEYAMRVAKLAALAKRRKLRKEELERLQMCMACMRMICDTPFILDQECRISPKLEELELILDELLSDSATKVLLFSEWVKMLDLIKELAHEKGIGFAEHTGRVPQKRRRTEIHRFKKEPDCRLFLSSESGGSGLNLQAANVVINVDLPWNPAKLEQRIARAWRKHQTRTVNVINLVSENSIESAMLEKLAFKQQLADSVIDGNIPEGGLVAKRGSKAFIEQVNLLMGTDITTGPEKKRAPEPEAEVPPAEQLRQDVAARLPSQVLGIEATEDNAILVVAKHDNDIPGVRDVVAESAPEAQVEVLDLSTYELLRRLEEQGIIAFTGKTKSVFRSSELGEEIEKPPPAPPRFKEEALSHLEKVSRKRKMAGLLAGGELYAEALPPAHDAFNAAVQSLYVFRNGTLPDEALTQRDIMALSEQANLATSLTTHKAALDGCDPQSADAAQVVQNTVAIIDEVETAIRNG